MLQPSLGAVGVAAPAAGSPADDSGELFACTVTNLELSMEGAQLLLAAREAIARDIIVTGAIEVDELTREDCEQLPFWHRLKPFEKTPWFAARPSELNSFELDPHLQSN